MARLTSTPIFVKIGQKMWLLQQLEISQKEGVCVKKGYDTYIYIPIYLYTYREHFFVDFYQNVIVNYKKSIIGTDIFDHRYDS